MRRCHCCDLLSAQDSNLQSVWHLGDSSTTIWDSVGSAHGSLSGTGGLNQQDGRWGKGLGFNGIDDYVVAMDAADPTAYTVSIWIKPSDQESMDIFYRGDSGSGRSHLLGVDSDGKFVHLTYDGSDRTITGDTVIIPGKWYHVVITAENSGSMKLYVNGYEEGSWATLGTMWTAGDRWYMGRSRAYGWFAGTLDEVMYWDVVLGDDEIKDLYNYGSGRFYGTTVSSSSSSSS